MTYGTNFNLYFKDDETPNQQKIEQLKLLNTGDVLTNLRNIESDPTQFHEDIIKAVYGVLFDRNIICI